MAEPSGPQSCARFPGSKLTKDLLPDFRDRVDAFISAMTNGGATFRRPHR
jgi:hypothetical protein